MLIAVKSKIIVKLIFNHLEELKKLKIINHNKRLINLLNIQLITFKNNYLLKEFNRKYDLNIKSVNIKKLEIKGNPNIYKILKNLNNIGLKEIKSLYLEYNNISYINILEKLKLEKLIILNLSHNNISNINLLEKVNFKELKGLGLNYNKISNIDVLERVKFDKLEILCLDDNQISDISVLKNVNFKE